MIDNWLEIIVKRLAPPLTVTPQNTWTNSGRFEPYRHTTSFFCRSIFFKPAAAEIISDSSWAKLVSSPVIPFIYQKKNYYVANHIVFVFWNAESTILL
jgi:hypothetical protein